MKRILASIFVLLFTHVAAGQDIYSPVLQQIEKNSTTLAALKKQASANKLGNHTGIAPANPEVEFGHAWGRPSDMGTRMELSVKQAFDFPTVYLQKRRVAHFQDMHVDYTYLSQRIDLLLRAKNICIELVYYNALRDVYGEQYGNAKQILQAYEKMQQQGTIGMLEYNKAVLNFTDIDAELKRIDLERSRLLSELQQLNGGMAVPFTAMSYPIELLPNDFDDWYANAETALPLGILMQSAWDISNLQVDLARAESLPKFHIGYTGEFSAEENFQGVSVGITIPLWESKNRVKQAKAEAQAAESMLEDTSIQLYNQYRNLYEQARLLQESALRYRAVLNNNNNAELLFKAFNNGEISLLDYLLEMEYYYNTYDKCLQTERDLALVLASLHAHELL